MHQYLSFNDGTGSQVHYEKSIIAITRDISTEQRVTASWISATRLGPLNGVELLTVQSAFFGRPNPSPAAGFKITKNRAIRALVAVAA